MTAVMVWRLIEAPSMSPAKRHRRTYLGGSGDDRVTGIVLDFRGRLLVCGSTASSDFPVVNPLQAKSAGGTDAFLAVFRTQGDALEYSTYFGGTGDDAALSASWSL